MDGGAEANGTATGQEFFDERWGESEGDSETEGEEGEESRISNDCRDRLIVQAAAAGLCITGLTLSGLFVLIGGG